MEHFKVKAGSDKRLPAGLCDVMGWENGAEINIQALPGGAGIKMWSDAEPNKVAIFTKRAAA